MLMIFSIFAAAATIVAVMALTVKISGAEIKKFEDEKKQRDDDKTDASYGLKSEAEEYGQAVDAAIDMENSGDYGWEDEPDITNIISTERRDGESYAVLLCRMAFKYNNGMIYKEGGYEWGGIIEPSQYCPATLVGVYGIGNEAYVQMLYMYTFSYVPKELYDLGSIDKYCLEISAQELMTGDIAVCDNGRGIKDYAVCIGQKNGHKLFSHCVNTGNEKFPNGCSKVCYNKNEYDSYYRGNEPAAFTRFYRSPISVWD